MDLVYDGRIYRMQRAGGINRYFAEIISRLPLEWTPWLLGANDLGKIPPHHPNLSIRNGPRFRPRRASGLIGGLMWSHYISRRAALLHPTYYGLCDGLSLGQVRCPVVITVQDLSYAVYADITDQAEPVIRSQREAALRADHIICVSKSTEQRLLERIPQASGKTTVIHHGTSFRPNGAQEPAAETGLIRFLYVGARARYKNFTVALHAFAKASRACRDIRLTVAGPPLEGHERWQIHLLGIADLVSTEVYPDEERLRKLYCQSAALLYPSQHEGFGHPPLEAMACGTLAITGNTTSLPEVVGDAGIMLDPTNVDDWASCITAIANGTLDRAPYIQRGLFRASRFTWDASFEQHLAIYKRLARPH